MRSFVYLFLLSLISFPSLVQAQFDFGEMEKKVVKGKVVDPKGTGIPFVDIVDPRGFRISKTKENGSFAFPMDVALGSKVKPVIEFHKEGYQTYSYKYDYSSFVTITLTPDQPLEDEEVVIEMVPQEAKPDLKENIVVKNVAPTSKPADRPINEIHSELEENLEKVDEVSLKKQELEAMKEYIAYLENILEQAGETYDARAYGNSSIITKAVKEKITELKEKVALKEQELAKSEKERVLLWWILGAVVLILIPTTLAVIFYRNNKVTKKLNVQLQDQVVQIQQQTEEIATQRDNIIAQSAQLEEAFTKIQSSILYAKKIQESTLVKPTLVSDQFKDLFVYYRPKDIVSGDFYWFGAQEGKMVLAAVDCTGHGVPGAFMTMLGQSLLQEIVNQKKITDPGAILAALHQGVATSLHQSEEDSAKDGMDISLVTVDMAAKKLTFAGANNPIYLIRDGGIEQIRGSRTGIGGEGQNLNFETHDIDLTGLSAFFLCSDGFQDQFGGDQGKKYMKKSFREYLLKIADLPAEEQKASLETELTSWMQYHTQTDDILVMGVKV